MIEENTDVQTTAEAAGTETEQVYISYEDFAKLDIRIGTIISAEPVEGTDKLLHLQVDLGEAKPRQIISGIRLHVVDPVQLVGMQCPFIANLEPRTIRGLESQGMILAAGDDIVGFLNPHMPLKPGTAVA